MHVAADDLGQARPERSVRLGRRAVEAVLALSLAAIWAWAFVGLDASGYWTDELWTVFVVKPGNGLGQVLHRSLIDTNPPAYYLIIHFWSQLFGDSELATRSFSALCAVGATAVFVGTTRRAYSLAARLFGAIAGASSLYWFEQSQNMRGYALAMLIVAGLIGCAVEAARRSRAGRPVGWDVCVGLAALGALGAFVHYYVFFAVGLVYLALLATVPDRRLRTVLTAAGAVILAATVGYQRMAHQHTAFTHLWFSNDRGSLAIAFRRAAWTGFGRWGKRAVALLLVGAAYGLWRRRVVGGQPGGASSLGRWTGLLAVYLIVGLTLVGLAVSLLLQPSLSDRNLLICEPALWCVAAWIYDEAVEGASPRIGLGFAALAGLLVALQALALGGRLVNRNEDWRGSAQYINSLSPCAGRDIPVVLPSLFGPDTPFFRRLAERDLFGWYYRGGGRLLVESKRELAASRQPALVELLAARSSGVEACPVLAWGVHDLDDAQAGQLAQALARRPEVQGPVVVRHFHSHAPAGDGWRPAWPDAYVFEAARPKAS